MASRSPARARGQGETSETSDTRALTCEALEKDGKPVLVLNVDAVKENEMKDGMSIGQQVYEQFTRSNVYNKSRYVTQVYQDDTQIFEVPGDAPPAVAGLRVAALSGNVKTRYPALGFTLAVLAAARGLLATESVGHPRFGAFVERARRILP